MTGGESPRVGGGGNCHVDGRKSLAAVAEGDLKKREYDGDLVGISICPHLGCHKHLGLQALFSVVPNQNER